MSFKVTYTITYKVPNPPDIRDFAAAHVPSELEIAAAPELAHTPVLTMYLQGEEELNELNRNSRSISAVQTDSGVIKEQTWDSETDYNQSVIPAEVTDNLNTADISNTLRVYLRIKQLYNAEYVESIVINKEEI